MTDPNTPDDPAPLSENSPTAAPNVPLTPPAAPAYGASPYVPPTYPTPPSYPTPPAYGAAPGYGTPPPQTPPVAAYGYGGYGAARRTNGMAIAALVLSILGFVWVLPLIGSLLGAILGHVALGQIARSNEGGRALALTGVIVGWVGVALLVLGVALIFFIAAAGSVSRYA